MQFEHLSSSSDALDRFAKASVEDSNPYLQLLNKKISVCNYRLVLITCNSFIDTASGNINIDQDMLDLHKAWGIIRNEGMVDMVQQKEAWKVIDRIGGDVTINQNSIISPNLRRFQNDPSENRFFVLLTGKEPEGLPVFELNSLINLWQINQGCIPIHASGVIHHRKLYVFAGPSGAGKSTISALSERCGDTVLDEDQLLIRLEEDHKYYCQAWGKKLQASKIPIQAIIRLTQDAKASLRNMNSLHLAQFLFGQVIQVTGKNLLSFDMARELFLQVSKLTKQIPGYELHFRKSADFWQLIEREFPD